MNCFSLPGNIVCWHKLHVQSVYYQSSKYHNQRFLALSMIPINVDALDFNCGFPLKPSLLQLCYWIWLTKMFIWHRNETPKHTLIGNILFPFLVYL